MEKNIKNNIKQPAAAKAMAGEAGQVMMIVVMVLSVVIIGATTIGGLLTARQIKQTANAGNFSKALFAADAGLEWRVYKLMRDDYECIDCPNGNACGVGIKPSFNDSDISLPDPTCVSILNGNSVKITSSATYKDTSYSFSKDIPVK